jgi:alpha-beta hydrolase superfamily lysophospholipase
MKQTEGTFKGLKDLDLYYQAWLPDKDPKAVLLVVHGLAEHIGRYKNLVNYFVPHGYAIYGFDLRGHGKSQGLKGYVEHFSYYLDDLKTFFDMVRRENAGKKIFMVGHSMGGLIATVYAIEHQNDLPGLVVSAQLLKVGASISPATIAMAKVLSVIVPKMGVAVLDASTISRDKAVVDAYVSDPLVYRGKTTARLGVELINTQQKLPDQLPKITLPILIMYGSEDKLCDPEGSKMLYEKVGSKDKTLKVYNGLYHEIFNEPEHEKVMADMEAWLSTRI